MTVLYVYSVSIMFIEFMFNFMLRIERDRNGSSIFAIHKLYIYIYTLYMDVRNDSQSFKTHIELKTNNRSDLFHFHISFSRLLFGIWRRNFSMWEKHTYIYSGRTTVYQELWRKTLIFNSLWQRNVSNTLISCRNVGPKIPMT